MLNLLGNRSVVGVGRGAFDWQDASATKDTGFDDGAELVDGGANWSRFLLLLFFLLGVGGGIFGDFDGWDDGFFEGLLAFALGDNGKNFFLDWQDLLGDLAHWLDDFANFLDDWLDDFVDDTVGFFFGAGGLDLTLWTWNVDLLDGNWGGSGSEFNGDWSQVWFDDNDLWGNNVFTNWDIDDFLGAGSDDGSGDWANLDSWASWADSGLDLGGTLGGEGTGKSVTSGGNWDTFNSDWGSNNGTLLVGGNWGGEAITRDGSLGNWAGVSGSGEKEDGSEEFHFV